MKKKNNILPLIAYVNDTIIILEEIMQKQKSIELRENWQISVLMGKIIDNYYTSLETLFMRISRFFENDLDSRRWHKDLLDKMRLKIKGVRQPVISEKTCIILREFLEFRHFYRYYVRTEYNWEQLLHLHKQLLSAHHHIKNDLKNFLLFLKKL